MPLSNRRNIHQRRTRRLFLEPLEPRELMAILVSIGVGTASSSASRPSTAPAKPTLPPGG